MCANTTIILKPMDQGVIFTFKSYYVINIPGKSITAIDNGSFDGSKESKMKTFRKELTILDAIKNIYDSWEQIKILTLTGV